MSVIRRRKQGKYEMKLQFNTLRPKRTRNDFNINVMQFLPLCSGPRIVCHVSNAFLSNVYLSNVYLSNVYWTCENYIYIETYICSHPNPIKQTLTLRLVITKHFFHCFSVLYSKLRQLHNVLVSWW